ncbi:tryptophan-rich sensory protein [Salisediminibacterium halotolerans]|uniref:tryptophan-rich sensory protein n=1 Tax=Salisediminibacterium halotolerans TaxID=517425 RepID=UPI000EB4123F|nr:tryptophan-rich sensory protein [Salisediminibacterium halotolerans]RLJ69287.1 TspO/MBR related protein [Actinophytocola xinjiangensis]RPE86978.1 TspO/MBR related protein [Salisediminibacterium halotolerans]TWG32289.1 TspO/MBR related protein [Salisediminibacterium halotolerans]GEL08816.1 hypothetical protein SHA02_22320 [Salisediminibacterium halotolerans]
MKKLKPVILLIINSASMAIILIMNTLANVLPLNGQTTGEISANLNVLFTPAGYVFSIWSVIYALLTIWIVRSWIVSGRSPDKTGITAIKYAFAVNALLNAAWIVLFHYEFFLLTFAVMTGLLVNLIAIYRRIQHSYEADTFTLLPFSIYLGWISVAFILNIGVVFNSFNFEQGLFLTAETWTAAALLAGVLLAVLLSFLMQDAVYPLVFVWAYIGIFAERSATEPMLAFIASAGAIVIASGAISQLLKQKRFLQKNSG